MRSGLKIAFDLSVYSEWKRSDVCDDTVTLGSYAIDYDKIIKRHDDRSYSTIIYEFIMANQSMFFNESIAKKFHMSELSWSKSFRVHKDTHLCYTIDKGETSVGKASCSLFVTNIRII